MSIFKGQMTFTWYLGGAESGAASWGDAYTGTCDVLKWQDNNRSVTVDDTVVCDGFVTDVGIRADRTIALQVRVPAGRLLFGSAVNQHVKFIASIPTTGTATSETLVGVIRRNDRGAEGDNRILQDIEIRVRSIAASTAPA
jgi:hypothetical protein